jgi:2-polyprenyl-3-methyl-5-hydroxy-6-metoxy-1,4-benzoquinol methylase
MSAASYVGGELALFQRAHNWKAYLRAQIDEFVRGDVLEVGAGVGATTAAAAGPAARSWLCLEPDPELASQLELTLSQLPAPSRFDVVVGTLEDLPSESRFDCVLYIDVLEHIERDGDELARVAEKLAPGGHLIVMSPAHAFLMSPFDHAIGHYRRYDRHSLPAVSPPGLDLCRLRYLDSCGLLASLANRVLLRQSLPTPAQIALWDQRMIPISRRLDPWLAYRLGKSILAVWRRGLG